MDANGDHEVDVSEFVSFMAMAVDGLSDNIVDTQIQALVEGRLAGRFHYDFSGVYCGTRGVLPILAALSFDRTFESLDLSGCNIDNDGAELLANIFASHPVRSTAEFGHADDDLHLLTTLQLVQAVKEIRLRGNRISAPGIRSLTRMLNENNRIVEMDVSGNLCERGFSCVDHATEGCPGTEAIYEMKASLRRNQARLYFRFVLGARLGGMSGHPGGCRTMQQLHPLWPCVYFMSICMIFGHFSLV